MKVKNTSRRVINLMHGKVKLTLVPGTDEAVEVDDCADVQWYIDHGDLAEVAVRSKSKLSQGGDGDSPLTVPQIKAALKEKGVEIPEGVTKRDDLLALLDAASEDKDA